MHQDEQALKVSWNSEAVNFYVYVIFDPDYLENYKEIWESF